MAQGLGSRIVHRGQEGVWGFWHESWWFENLKPSQSWTFFWMTDVDPGDTPNIFSMFFPGLLDPKFLVQAMVAWIHKKTSFFGRLCILLIVGQKNAASSYSRRIKSWTPSFSCSNDWNILELAIVWDIVAGWWYTYPPKNMSSSVGVTLPSRWKQKCSKPPTSWRFPAIMYQSISMSGTSNCVRIDCLCPPAALLRPLADGGWKPWHLCDTPMGWICWTHRIFTPLLKNSLQQHPLRKVGHTQVDQHSEPLLVRRHANIKKNDIWRVL